MRHFQVRLAQHKVAHQYEVEIEGPRRSGVRSGPAALGFDPHERSEQRCRSQRTPAHHGSVEIARLRRDTDRRGLDELRYAHIGKQPAERRNCEEQVGAPIAQVAAEGDGGDAENGVGIERGFR